MEHKTGRRFKEKKPLIVLFIIAMFFAAGAVVMLLWNAILPDVVNVKPLNYWQALGILVLSKILFGGFGPGRHKRPPFGRHDLNRSTDRLTEEEKQKLRDAWRQ